MKILEKLIILSCLIFIAPLSAQKENKIHFLYDGSGNQTLRELVINEPSRARRQATFPDNVNPLEYQIAAYPNPTDGPLTLDWSALKEHDIDSIILVDASGNFSQRIYFSTKEKTLELDLRGYVTGIYFIRFILNNGVYFDKKIILY